VKTKTELALEVQQAARMVRTAAKASELLEEIVSEELGEMDVAGEPMAFPHKALVDNLAAAAMHLGDAVDILQACGMFKIASYDKPIAKPAPVEKKPWKSVKEQAAEARAAGNNHKTVAAPKSTPKPKPAFDDAAHPWR
jgi:hypothetical protein